MSRRGDFDRVAIVGTSCAGKSTLARELSRQLGAPHVELDQLFWGPNWTARSTEEFAASVERATAVIWLNYPLSTLLPRAVKSTFWRLVTRKRLFNGNREPVLGFLHSYWIPWWVLRTCGEQQREYAELLASPEYGHLRVIEIRSARQVAEMVVDLG